MRYLADPEQVEDLVQETYLRAFASLPRYAARSPARFWLLSIARRVAADQVRKAQRSPRCSGTDWHEAVDAHRLVPSASGLVEVEHAVAQLEPERREALVLTRVLGLSYTEAAEICGCPIGTIRSRVFRARSDLLAALTADEEAPPTATAP